MFFYFRENCWKWSGAWSLVWSAGQECPGQAAGGPDQSGRIPQEESWENVAWASVLKTGGGGYKTGRWFQGRNKILYFLYQTLDCTMTDTCLCFLLGHWCPGCLVARSPLAPSLCCVTWQKGLRGVKQLDLGSPFGMVFRCSDCPSPIEYLTQKMALPLYVLYVLRNS